MTQARKLRIRGPAGWLEAAVRTGPGGRGAAILAHPHPLFGGTLHNPVIFHADRELNRAGWTTLRFNFRGVGQSEGDYDGGRGEVGDVGAAFSWVRAAAPGAPIVLVGYSFGAWCSLRYAAGEPLAAAVVAVGLPVRLYPLDEAATLGRPLAVVQGGRDPLGSPEEVRRLIERANPPGRLHVVEDADHLFTGLAAEAAKRVVEAVDECSTARPGAPATGPSRS